MATAKAKKKAVELFDVVANEITLVKKTGQTSDQVPFVLNGKTKSCATCINDCKTGTIIPLSECVKNNAKYYKQHNIAFVIKEIEPEQANKDFWKSADKSDDEINEFEKVGQTSAQNSVESIAEQEEAPTSEPEVKSGEVSVIEKPAYDLSDIPEELIKLFPESKFNEIKDKLEKKERFAETFYISAKEYVFIRVSFTNNGNSNYSMFHINDVKGVYSTGILQSYISGGYVSFLSFIKSNFRRFNKIEIKKDSQLEIDTNKIKKCMSDVSKNYIYIGFYLTEIKDRKLYESVQQKDVYSFAEKYINLCRTTTKNLIRLYEVFGNGCTIQAGYEEYNYSQLVEMSAIDKKYWDKITPKTTIKQLRAIKKKELEDKETSAPSEKEKKPKEKKLTNEQFLEKYYTAVIPKLKDISGNACDFLFLKKVIEVLKDEKDLMLI